MHWPKIVFFWGIRLSALVTVLAPRLWT